MRKETEQCSCLYMDIKEKGSPGAFKHRAELEKSNALRSHNSLSTLPTLPLSPDSLSLLPNSQHGGHSQGPPQLPSLPTLQPAPSPGKSPRGGPSCSSRCG